MFENCSYANLQRGASRHGVMHHIAFGHMLLLSQVEVVVLIERNIRFFVCLQVAHHVFLVAEGLHWTQQLGCDALSLCLAGHRKIVEIPVHMVSIGFLQLHGKGFVGQQSPDDARTGMQDQANAAVH